MTKNLVLSQAQTDLKLVEATLKNAISAHATYIDKAGKKSTGSKGLAMQINIRVKKAFGECREKLNEKQLRYLVALQYDLIELIASGEANGFSRDTIKKTLYAVIDNYAPLVKSAA